jgi:mitochondrial fission protein ELM1
VTQVKASAQVAADKAPAFWLVVGDKLGDNAQAEIIVEALGWPCVRKELRFKARYATGKPWFRPSLRHLDLAGSAALEPPWPALILTIGRRPAMAALWVRKQSQGRTRVAVIGRPRRGLHNYDLVIAPPQFRVPPRANTLRLDLPLMRIDEAAVEAAHEPWEIELGALPRPLTAVLVGGPTRPFRFDATVARDLMERTLRSAGTDGTLYVTTSRRTPAPVAEALAAALPEGARLFRWSPEAQGNPYRGLLAHADRFVVTGDSISMMTEVARLGRPLAVYQLPVTHPAIARLQRVLAERLVPPEGSGSGIWQALGAALVRLGAIGYERDLSTMHEALFARGLAVPIGDPFRAGGGQAPDDLEVVARRLRELLEAAD